MNTKRDPWENLDSMTEQEERDFWLQFESDIAKDDGAAARGHLAAGFPIYVRTGETPKGLVEKRFPDGKRQLVKFDLTGEHVVLDLPATCAEELPPAVNR